jgi:hypothetical protein
MLIFLLLLAVSMVMAGMCWNAVLDDLRRSFPTGPDNVDLRFLVGPYVWSPFVSDEGRRQYIGFQAWAVVMMLSITGLIWPDHPIGAVVTLTLAAAATISIGWRSYDYWIRRPKRSKRDQSN